ncbi:hypothetical protein [Brevibacillus laterosporus]|uniref:hypothetical protein n=1 Tax=Brevibacillus laterosporus TaxID=1465 RepID=UPI003D2348EB
MNETANTASTQEVSDNLKDTYAARYATPKNNSEAINILSSVFAEILGNGSISFEIRDGIGEYYRILSNRELPAFEWMMEAFHVASKKDNSKRNFPYVVGMLRVWMKYGFGHVPSQEEEDIVTYFEEITSTEVTPKARLLIQNLMGTYGGIKVTIMIGQLNNNKDLSMIMAEILKNSMDEKYSKEE